MSAIDVAVGAIISLSSVVVGILLTSEIDSRRQKERKSEKVVFIANSMASVFMDLIKVIGMNQSKLGPIMARNLEGKGFNKASFKRIVDDALSVFPLPLPDEIPLPKDDPYGYALVEIANEIRGYVVTSNELAQEIRSGNQSSEILARFMVSLERSVDVDIVIGTGAKEFSLYLDTLEDIHGTKMPKREREQGVAKFESDLRNTYTHAVELGKIMEQGVARNVDFLKTIGWDS